MASSVKDRVQKGIASSRRSPAIDASEPLISAELRDVLTAVGEVVYEWSIPDDSLRWSDNALAVLKAPSFEHIATGRAFAALLDPANAESRQEVVMGGSGADKGAAYQIQYSLLPDGKTEAGRLWIEDIGRWYPDERGRPARAHGVLRVINERYEREQRLAFLSRYDELTGFFNRTHLMATLGDALARARRLRGSIGFMVVAVDNIRAINEAYGFDVADQVLAMVGRRIRAELRGGDAIGRYSGTKLGLVLIDCDDEAMRVAARRFQAAIRDEVIAIEGGSVATTASIGGVSLPRHGKTVNEAIARAREALHLARQRGNDHFAAYAHSPSRRARRRGNAALSSELVSALNKGWMKLVFQPVVDIKTRAPVFYEALLRLAAPNRSTVIAGDFIALSERLGLIHLIDHRVLDLALEALTQAPAVTLSVNLSAETVGNSEWMARLSESLAARSDLAERLIIEITESAVIRNIEEAAHFVAQLHRLGCRIAIDDFGAGFSSFRHLRMLDVDIVKIDGAFVENLAESRDDQVFVRTLVELARNFGIETVAEWVQDERTAAMLAGWGVDRIQGKLSGEPSAQWPPSAEAAKPAKDPVSTRG